MPIDINVANDASLKAMDAMKLVSKSTGSVGGCGRVYIDVCDAAYKPMRASSKVAKAFEAAGFKVFKRPGHVGVQLYIGYDNGTGFEWTQGVEVERVLREAGIKAFLSGDGD